MNIHNLTVSWTQEMGRKFGLLDAAHQTSEYLRAGYQIRIVELYCEDISILKLMEILASKLQVILTMIGQNRGGGSSSPMSISCFGRWSKQFRLAEHTHNMSS